MFHWICPECGREIPPAVKECPACDPQAVSAQPPELPQLPKLPPLPEPAPAAAASVKPTPSDTPFSPIVPPALRGLRLTPLANAIQANAIQENSRPPGPPAQADAILPAPTATALLYPAAEVPGVHWPGPDFTKRTQPLLPAAQAPLALGSKSGPKLESLGFNPVLLPPIIRIPNRANDLVPAADHLSPPPLPAPAAAVTPASELPTAEYPALEQPAAKLTPPDRPAVSAASRPGLAALADALTPETTAAAKVPKAAPEVVLPLAAAFPLLAPRALRADPARALGELSCVPLPLPAVARPTLVSGDLPTRSPRLVKDNVPIPAGRKVDVPASRLGTLGQAVLALPAETAKPIRPELWPAAGPPFAGLVDYTAGARRAMRPIRPAPAWFVPPAEPRITLPGPMLPRELNSLAEAGLRTVHETPRSVRRRSGSGRVWLVLMGVTLAAVAAVYILPGLVSDGKPAAVEAEASTAATPDAAPATPASRPPGAYALSRTVEVTGFRFALDLNGKSQIHYLVVNHSGAQFGGVTVYVTLREATAKAGQPPVSRFSFRAPEMAPYSSREMTSPIERVSRQASLPDWQNLQAEVEIAE